MAERPKLEIVDDPVAGAAAPPTPPRPARPRTARPQTAAARRPAPDPERSAEPAVPSTPSDASSPADEATAAPSAAQGLRKEEKRAVFGRVPRSLSRRLERAVVELREEMEDLTQEQVLAALLSQHVDPGDPEKLAALTQTVRSYREQP